MACLGVAIAVGVGIVNEGGAWDVLVTIYMVWYVRIVDSQYPVLVRSVLARWSLPRYHHFFAGPRLCFFYPAVETSARLGRSGWGLSAPQFVVVRLECLPLRVC